MPESLDAAELTRRLDDGEWVVDLRRRVAFASSHLKGSVSFEYGTGSSSPLTWAGCCRGVTQLTLVGSQEDLERHPRPLPDRHRIPGRRRRNRPARPGPAGGPRLLPPRGLGRCAGRPGAGDTVLDVRRADEFAGSRVVGAVNVPLHELLLRLEDVPAGKLWVHCGSGYRAGVAASLLQRAGRDVVHIDARFARRRVRGVTMDTTRLMPG